MYKLLKFADSRNNSMWFTFFQVKKADNSKYYNKRSIHITNIKWTKLAHLLSHRNTYFFTLNLIFELICQIGMVTDVKVVYSYLTWPASCVVTRKFWTFVLSNKTLNTHLPRVIGRAPLPTPMTLSLHARLLHIALLALLRRYHMIQWWSGNVVSIYFEKYKVNL